MTTSPLDDRPPSYMSQNSQTSTLIDRADPPTSTILKPDHSTRASRLSYATSQGRYSILEYHALTFPLLFSHCGRKMLIVIAVDEDLDTLINDVQRVFNTSDYQDVQRIFNTSDRSNRIRELRVTTFTFVGRVDLLQEGNITATLRFLKARSGTETDVVLAK